MHTTTPFSVVLLCALAMISDPVELPSAPHAPDAPVQHVTATGVWDPGPAPVAEATSAPLPSEPSEAGVERIAAPALVNRETEPTPAPAAQPEPAGADWVLDVPGYCGDWGCIQSSVDSMSLVYIDFGTGLVDIAGHNHGPAGVIASMSVGDTVEVRGNGAGTYVIYQRAMVPRGTDIGQIAPGMVLQTCVGDQLLLQYVRSV